MYGYHFGYQFWREDYALLKASPPNSDPFDELRREVWKQFWYLCLERVPTACFEKGEPDPRHCLSKLIHPREFPAYDVASDLYQKFMERPDTWLVEWGGHHE